MSVCIQCGHELGVGRFCTNCGHPVDAPVTADNDDWRTETAERQVVLDAPSPILPPPAHTAPVDPPRYPLFADEVASPDPDATREQAVVSSAPTPAPEPPTSPPSHRRLVWWPWVIVAAVMLLVAFLGIQLLTGGDDQQPAASDTTPSREKSKSDKPTRQQSPTESAEPGEPTDVARSATARVPATAPPNEDVDGNLVRYEARNMLDGVPSTCWRMAGDGTGETVTFELAEETTLTQVGIINGYAKIVTEGGGPPVDWYAGNRRILAVEWVFDDGTTVRQDLEETIDLQVIDLDLTVVTSTIQLRLLEVSPPGRGRTARNYTAISDVALVGSPT